MCKKKKKPVPVPEPVKLPEPVLQAVEPDPDEFVAVLGNKLFVDSTPKATPEEETWSIMQFGGIALAILALLIMISAIRYYCCSNRPNLLGTIIR
jgi:hypothetical protein